MNRSYFFQGSFDPFTRGHLAIVLEVLASCDKLIIAVGESEAKTTSLFADPEKRIELIKSSIQDIITQYRYRELNNTSYSVNEEKAIKRLMNEDSCVEIVSYRGLTIHAAMRFGANFIIRGVRDEKDFSYEMSKLEANRQIAETCNYSVTQLLIPAPHLGLIDVSSSRTKNFCKIGQYINAIDFVMPSVHNEMMKIYLKPVFFSLAEYYGAKDVSQVLWRELSKVYSEKDRIHHNFSHLSYGINMLNNYRDIVGGVFDYEQVLLAYFYHRTISSKNIKSPSALNEFFTLHFVDFLPKAARIAFNQGNQEDQIKKMINNTTRLGVDNLNTIEERLLCDIDLATLGDPKNYGLYSQSIRMENLQMETLEYARSRHKLLNKLVKRNDLFHEDFFAHLNDKAAINLNHEKAYWLNVKEKESAS